VWGGRYPIVWGGELIESKKRERETGHQPWWPPFFAEQRNNKKIAGVSGGGSEGREIRPGRNVWDDAMSSFRPSNRSTKKKRKKHNAA